MNLSNRNNSLEEAAKAIMSENAIIHDDFLNKNLGKELDLTISSVSQVQRSPGKFGKAWVMTFKGYDKKNKSGMKAEFGFFKKNLCFFFNGFTLKNRLSRIFKPFVFI